MTSLQSAVNSISSKGRAGDSLVGHLTPHDLVIPAEIQTPEMLSALRQFFAKNGTKIEEYVAGHPSNKKNPKTGIPEFGWFKDILHSVEKPFQDVGTLIKDPNLKNLENVGHDIVPIAETAGLSALGVPLPLAAAGVGGVNTAIRGGSPLQSLESAGLGAATAYGGQQLIGAGEQAFPETAASISDSIPNFGISDNLNSLAQSLGFGGSAASATGNTIPSSTATSAPTNTPSAGTAGGGAPGAGGGVAPAGVDIAQGFEPDATTLSQGFGADTGNISPSLNNAAQAVNNTGNLSTVGSPSTSSNLPGTPGVSANSNDPYGLFAAGGQSGSGAPTGGNSGSYGYDINGNSTSLSSLASAASAANGSPAPNSFSQFIKNPSFSNAGNIITSNPGAAIAAAGVGLDALRGEKESGAEKNLKQEASRLDQQGAQLQGYLQSGTLPPGLQSSLNQASNSAKAQIRSRFASMGLSGSSSEQQELAAVDERAQAQSAQMAEQLLTTGINESGAASQLYQSLLGDSLKEDQGLSGAIANFASAAAGGGGSGLNSKGGQTFTLQPG